MTIIENIFSEENFFIGEALYENGAISGNKLKGNIWKMVVESHEIYNVEIKGFDTKSIKYKCSCETFSVEKECPHIVASCLHIRKVNFEENPKPLTPKKTKQVNIAAILNHVSHEELKLFVKQASKRDRNLNFMLKSVFAGKLDLDDNAKKYSDLLSPLIKPATGMKSSVSDTRLALKLISEFRDQLEDALSLAQFTTVFDIINGVLYKIHYLYRHYPKTRDKTNELIVSFNSYISKLYTSNLAPNLLDKLDEVVVEVASLSYYNYLDQENDLAYQLYSYNRSHALDKLSDEIAEIKLSRIDSDERPVVVALKELLGIDIIPSKTILTDQQHIEGAETLARWNNHEKGIQYIKSLQNNKQRNRAFEYALISAYDNSDQKQKAISLTVDYYLQYKEYRFVRILKELNKGEIPEKLTKKVSKEVSNIDKQYPFKALWYKAIEDDKSLLSTLYDSKDLRLIMEYDQYLYSKDFTAIEKIYIDTIDDYLASHAGTIATDFIVEIKQHITNIRAFKLLSSIKSHLNKNHSHRTLGSDYN